MNGYNIVSTIVLVVFATALCGCATYTFKCQKSVSWAVKPDSNPAQLTGMCDGKKTVILEGPGPAKIQHVCDEGKMHWFDGDSLTCIENTVCPGHDVVFTPDGNLACSLK